MRIRTILRILPLVALAACGRETTYSPGDLQPGALRLIALEPVGADPGARLMPNGAFEEWYAGLPAPTGFAASRPAEGSSIRREIQSGLLGTTGYTVRQTWTALNHAASPRDHFHAALELAPETRYLLDVVAVATPGMQAAIGAYELDAEGRVRVLARAVVKVSGADPTRYQGTFDTVAGGTVVLASAGLSGSTLPGSVTWSAWELSPQEAALDPPLVVDAPARRLLAHQALDQLRSQFALYGGEARWAEALYPVEKNLARILREAEPLQSESVLGYDGYVFRKSELAYYTESQIPARTAIEPERAAWTALLNAERALAGRGIHLLLIPVPDRITLYVDQIYKAAATGPMPLLPHARWVDQLLRHDVLVQDPAPLLWQLRNQAQPVYWRGDDALPGFTARSVAALAAEAIHALLPTPTATPAPSYNLTVDTIPLEQRLRPELMPAQRGLVPAEEFAIYTVREDGKLYTAPERATVLAVGSYAVAHHIRGASFAANLAHALGAPVAIPKTNLDDTAVPAFLAGDEAPLDAVKVVVFCLPDAALLVGN